MSLSTTITSSWNVEAVSDALLAAVGNTQIKTFKWKASVAEKGEAAARKHIGIVAEDFVDALAAEGLSPGDNGVYVESVDEDGTKHSGIRHAEFQALEIERLRRQNADFEARLTALEP